MVYLLPGMGASAQMYGVQWDALGECVRVDWGSCVGCDSIAEVADKLVERYSIGEEDIVVGSSLGGMVAQEVAKRGRVKKVFCVGSAIDGSEVNSLIRGFGRVARFFPYGVTQRMAGWFKGDLARWYSESDSQFLRSMSISALEWGGVSNEAENVVRIHGSRDWVIPMRSKGAKVDHVVDGGHLIAMTHPVECVELVSSYLKVGGDDA